MRLLLLFLTLLLFQFLTGCRDAPTPLVRVEATRPLMGTLFKVITHSTDRDKAKADLEEALDLAEDFARRATDYDPDSELNRLTRAPVGTPVTVSSDLFAVLRLGQKIALQSEGLFDPTYGPLTRLWRDTDRTGRLPGPQEIEAARSRCGIKHLTFDDQTETIAIDQPGMQLDLGGIAKGYAADLIFDHLVAQGYPRTLVAAAGDIRLGDPPPDKEAWTIGLRSFRLAPTDAIPLRNAAISTSGDLFQRTRVGEKTYSHLIDPETGLGLTTRRAASVILPEAKLTDPLATVACLVDDPLIILKHHPGASLRILYEDPDTPPVVTGVFAQ